MIQTSKYKISLFVVLLCPCIFNVVLHHKGEALRISANFDQFPLLIDTSVKYVFLILQKDFGPKLKAN